MRRGSGSERGRVFTAAIAVAFALGAVAFWLAFHVPPGRLEGPSLRIALASDLVNYFVPMSQYVAARLATGEIPLWNPHFCSGIPLLATLQNSPFQPRIWLALWLPAHQATAVAAFAHCSIGGALAMWLFWRWTRDGFAALLGGLLFLSVCMLGYTFWPPALATLTWLPLLVICVDVLAGSLRPIAIAGLAAAVAMQVFAGFPQLMVYNFVFLAPYAAFRLLRERRAGLATLSKRAAALALAVALGLGLSAVQLLPGLELVGESARVEAPAPERIHYLTGGDSRGLADVVRRTLDPAPRLSLSALGGSDYLGISTLVLLAVGLVGARRDGRTWLLAAVGTAALVLADGYHGALPALYGAWAKLPVAGALRTPERMRIVAEFCAIALAVLGFTRLARPQRGEVRVLRGAVVVAALAIGAAVAFAGAVAGAWRALLAGGLALGLIEARRGRLLHGGLRLSLVVLVFADLLLATGSIGILRAYPVEWTRVYRAERGGRILPPAQLDAELREAGLGRLAFEGYWPLMISRPAQWGYRTDCYEPLLPAQWTSLHRELTGGFPDRTTLESPPRGGAQLETFHRAAGVVATLRPGPGGRPAPEPEPDALPRAYRIGRHRVVADEVARAHLARGDADLRARVLLDRDPGATPSSSGLRPVPIVHYAPERVELDVALAGPGILVLSDTHYPGWTAHVDGEERPILRANGLYRAVALEPGDRRVVFRYRPASFRNGAALSALSLATCGAVLAAPALRRRALRRRSGGAATPGRPLA